jgi:glycosyltransferase involved in cell wall biosynthesis
MLNSSQPNVALNTPSMSTLPRTIARETLSLFPQQIQKILLVTDTWQETNGLTTTLKYTLAIGRQWGYAFAVLHPGMFACLRNPWYRQYAHALPNPWRLRRLLRHLRPDAVHIATEGPLGVTMRQECRKRAWRFTTSFHTRWDEHGKHLIALPSALVWRWLRWFHSRATRVLTPTSSVATLLRQHGFMPPLSLWERGIDMQLFHPRPHTHHGVQRPILLSVGRISREKNLPAFLNLNLPGTKYIVGDGPMLAEFQRTYGADIAAGRVVFFGERKGQALAELYAEADVFVFPSTTDTFGNVILEALASGVPVAAYPVSGPADILTNSHVGAMHEDLGQAVQAALAHGRAEACLALAKGYTWEAATEQFLRAIVPVQSPDYSSAAKTTAPRRPPATTWESVCLPR